MGAKEEEFDSWDTSTGLADAYRGKVKDGIFTFDPNYNDGDTLILKLDVLTDDAEIGEGGLVTESYPCGKGWTTKDKGKTAVREDGKSKKFNANSGMGRLIEGLKQLPDALDVMKKRGEATEAASYVGLDFDWERQSKEFTIDGESMSSSRMIPVAFHGEGGKSSSSSKKTETKADDDAGDASNESSSNGGGADAIPAKVKIKLSQIARECDSHDLFVERAYTEVDDVAGNSDLEAAVMDDSDAGIYATARA